MSGFEIAGVVLGALPLVAKALESYSEGLSIVQTVVHYEQQFEELHARFEFAWTMYFASCQRLLSPIAISSQESKELVEHPTSDRWKDPSLNLELRKRLGVAYEPYLIATRTLHKRVEKLKKKLKLNDDYLPRWVNKSGDIRSEDATERAKFFSRGRWSRVSGPIDVVRCKSLVDQIDNEIGRISNFVKDVTELEVPRKEQQHQIDSTYWMTVRDHAHRVFKGFESRWSRPCTCHQLHRASLQLHVRDTETRCDCSDHRLKCILSFQNDSNGSAGTPPLWDWRDIEIEPKPVDILQTQPTSASAPSVRFATPSSSNLNTASASTAPANNQKDHLATKIVDLCNALSSTAGATSTLGFLDEQTWKHYIHAAVHCKRPLATRTIMSLRDIINKRPQGDLSTKEKRTLALKMALAVLQLHDTPWIDSEYGHRSVFFITNTSSPRIPLFEPAYVSRSFVATNITNQNTFLKSDGRALAKNTLLYALGIALIELSYGQPLLTFALPSELDARGNATSRTEMLVAGRLLQEIRDRELVNYAWATARCVQCDLGYPFDYSLNDDTFRAKFIEKVIEPLKDDYDEIFLTK